MPLEIDPVRVYGVGPLYFADGPKHFLFGHPLEVDAALGVGCQSDTVLPVVRYGHLKRLSQPHEAVQTDDQRPFLRGVIAVRDVYEVGLRAAIEAGPVDFEDCAAPSFERVLAASQER